MAKVPERIFVEEVRNMKHHTTGPPRWAVITDLEVYYHRRTARNGWIGLQILWGISR